MRKIWTGDLIEERLRAQGVSVHPLGYVRLCDAANFFTIGERQLRHWLQEGLLESEQLSRKGRWLHVDEMANFLNKQNLEAGDY